MRRRRSKSMDRRLGLGLLEQAAGTARIPIFAIGGITAARVQEVRRAGGFGVAVLSSILSAADVEQATEALLSALEAADIDATWLPISECASSSALRDGSSQSQLTTPYTDVRIRKDVD